MIQNPNSFHNERQGRQQLPGGGIDPLVVLTLLLKNWYYFIIAIVIALFAANFYMTHTLPVYRVSTKILINEGEDRALMNNDELLQGLGLRGGMRNLDNQIMIIKSTALTEKVLDELNYEIEYYHKTVSNQIPIYPEAPIKVVSDNEIPLPRDTEFSVSYLGNNMFSLDSESDYYPLHKTASFGQPIEVPGGSFRIESWNEEWVAKNKENKLFFVIHSKINLINYFNSRIEVELLSRSGSILEISLSGINRAKDVEFLNKLAEVFTSISLDKKNIEAVRRIQFIDDQLVGITDSLQRTENKLQQFRSRNRVMDLSAQGQAIVAQVTLLENERARLTLEADYYDYLADYLAKDVSGSVPIVPITMGITDPGLTRLVTELANLQGQLSGKGAGEMNPLTSMLAQRVRSTKEALVETLKGLRRANSLAISDNLEQVTKVNAQASALPETERQLVGFERKFKLNDELYTFLLEMRSQQQMQKASNSADSEVVDPANELYATIVSPNFLIVYFFALFAGFGIPFLIVFLNFVFNKKVKDEEIRRMTDIPVVGNIPHTSEKINTIAFNSPNSTIAESFRLLRSRMQFVTKDAKSPVILITSSMPGDGKTFTAINLASVYSLLGKKTVLIGFDLRKPRIFNDFNLDNEKGVSTWLIGKDKLESIIKDTSFENLSVISAGPIPPNPSELIALEKTSELIQLLKERFDYIVIDSSPIGIVSDTYHLASLADACLLVVRPGRTMRDMLAMTLREVSLSGTKGLSMIINDIQADSQSYSYGEKYGYTSDNERTGRFRFFRRKLKNKKDKKV